MNYSKMLSQMTDRSHTNKKHVNEIKKLNEKIFFFAIENHAEI